MESKKIKPPCLKVNDEYETPLYAFEMLKCFENHFENKTVWDPFVCVTQEAGTRIQQCFPEIKKVIHTREFDLMQDRNPADFDIIVTNPPYSMKQKIWEKLLILNKPFCMLVPMETLGRKYITKQLEKIKDQLVILFPQSRVNFIPVKERIKKGNSHSPFHSVWICAHLEKPSKLVHAIQFMFLPQDSTSPATKNKRKHGELSEQL